MLRELRDRGIDDIARRGEAGMYLEDACRAGLDWSVVWFFDFLGFLYFWCFVGRGGCPFSLGPIPSKYKRRAKADAIRLRASACLSQMEIRVLALALALVGRGVSVLTWSDPKQVQKKSKSGC